MSKVPKRDNLPAGTLYARGVHLENIGWLQNNYRKQGYKSVGDFLNAILKDVKRGKR